MNHLPHIQRSIWRWVIQAAQTLANRAGNRRLAAPRTNGRGDLSVCCYGAEYDWTHEHDTPIGRPIQIANSLDEQNGAPIAGLL